MADNSATIIAASLNSEDLEKSINKLVETVATKTKAMADNFTKEVGRMEQAIKNLGNVKVDSGGTADGGSSRRTSKQKEEESQVKATTQAYKEQTATLDQQAAAIRKASQVSVRTGDAGSVRNADTLQTMNIQLDLLRERLLEARNQYSSFVAMASHATTTGDKGLYQFATEGMHKYEDEVRSLIPQIRGVQNAIQQMGDVIAPQGHTIQNYVNSLQKTNPELALLNEQFKKGQSELQNQSASYGNATQSAHQYTEEIRKQAQAIRESVQWKEKGYATVNGITLYNLEKDTTPLKSRISLEEQLLQLHKSEEASMMQQATDEEKVAQATRLTGEELKKIYQDQKAVNEEINKRANGVRNGGTTPFQSYDSLRQSIASVLGIQEQQVKMANSEKDSYNQLSSTLKHLKQAYDTLGKSDRNSDQGKTLVASIHEVERAMQQIRAQAARPVSLESIIGINGKGGLSEKTLDDIAYKMQRLASYRSGLDVNTRRAEIREVNAEYDRLKKKMDEVMQKNQQMIGSNNALGRSWNYMKNRLAFYFTVGASTQFIKNLIEVRSQYEMNERALGILINSAERGTQIFNELSQMALVSPYTLIELSNAAKQLTAYDIAAKDVVDTTRRLADMASAVGVPMERLTYALGQIKAYGYLNSRDARMFANAGIPLVRELSKYYTELEGKMVSVGDVYDRMKKKAIDFNSVMSVVTKMTDEGGKFFDFQAKMADTLKVRLANLTLAWNNMLNEMGAETQGVLTTAISSLRTLFTHWKDIDKLLKTIAWTFGMAKLVQVIQIANIGLAAFGKQMAWNILVGRKLSAVIFTVARSLKTLALSPITWITLLATAATAATMAIWNMNEAQESLNKSLRESSKDNYKNIEQFLENYNSIRDSLYKEEKDEETGKITITPIDIDKGEAKKAWEAIREQIELSSHASDEYIGKLLEVENISERVRKGFDVLEEIKVVSAALKELGDDAIKMDTDWSSWWNANLLPDGWVENLKDYEKELEKVRNKYEDVSAARERWQKNKFADAELNEDFVSLNSSLVKFRDNIATTAKSVFEFLKNKEWDADINKINEVFKQVGDRMIQEGQLNPKDAFVFQTQWETARSEASKKALELRIADEKNALQVAREENRKADVQARLDALQDELKDFDLYNGKSKAYWENFTKWLKEQHRSEMTEMFRGMDAEQIKSINFQEGEYGSWVNRMVEKYRKENKLSNDEVFQYLHHWVVNANKWSIFIPLTISTEGDKTIYQQLTEADSAIDTANKKIERLKTRRNELAEKGGSLSSDKKVAEEYNKVIDEISDAQEDYNKALEKGGHSKKESAAASKAQKAAESELQKALKDELQLIDKVRSQYKKLTDAGATDGEALTIVTNQFANSLAHVNNVLGKNGIPLFDISKFAGTDNPNALLDMLKLQLDSAKIAKNIKPEEIKELEVKYSEIIVDAKAYNLTKITKGLNNELDRLKEEYELAVSLDADPELGGMFADWMGIDINELPRTASEYAELASKELNKYLKENKANVELPNLLNITDDNLRAFEENKILTDKQLEIVRKSVQQARELHRKEVSDQIKDWDKLLEKYAEYETKINKIQNDAVKERVTFAQQFGTNDEKATALNLQTQILATTDPQEKQKLIQQLQELILSIAGDDKAKINLAVSIDNMQSQNSAKEAFEQFQKSPEWISATGDLAGMTHSALSMLINDLEDYKKSAKNLDGKQIEKINKALRNLYKQQRSGNVFNFMATAIDAAQNRMATFQPELDDITNQIETLYGKMDKSNWKEIQEEILRLTERFKKLKEEQKAVGKVSATDIVNGINQAISAAKTATDMFGEMATALGGKGMTEAAETIGKVVDTIEKAGAGAAAGAQIGGGYGAIIGAVVGGLTGIITNWQDVWSGNAAITEQIKDSEKAVKRLTTAYSNLEFIAGRAYGAIKSGADASLVANKQLQLAELEHQLNLEKSRDSKNRDDDRIEELRGEIVELRNEIKESTEEIVNDMLGISSASDGVVSLVSAMIEAFKNGEDAMQAFGDEWDKMIDNMILKLVVTTYMQKAWSQIMSDLENEEKKMLEESSKRQEEAQRNLEEANTMTDDDIAKLIAESLGYKDNYMEATTSSLEEAKKYSEEFSQAVERGVAQIETMRTGLQEEPFFYHIWTEAWQQVTDEEIAAYRRNLEAAADNAQNAIDSSSIDYTKWALDYMSHEGRERLEQSAEMLKDALGEWYTFGQDSEEKNLSALQQGIQGITEDTAGALEAYMNGVSQQVYYQSEVLTQIRDAVVMMDGDVQLGTQAQMLLQLQQSYAVQMAIQTILEGWSSPNGLAVRVEMQ